jgi:ferritin
MLDIQIEKSLNAQIEKEAYASYSYLSMAVWCDLQGLEGCAAYFYRQSEEEHLHMMKIIHYIIERNGKPIIPSIANPLNEFGSIHEIFELTLKQEMSVTQSIHEIITSTEKLNDYSTQNFLQWYVTEQREEEAVVMKILDKLKLIGQGNLSLYYIDKEVEKINTQIIAEEAGQDTV